MSDNELASSADEGSDAEKAEALNAKVQRVMAPLMKKMAKQAKKIASLEDALARRYTRQPSAGRRGGTTSRLVASRWDNFEARCFRSVYQ